MMATTMSNSISVNDFLIINWLITVFFVGGIRYMARWFLAVKAPSYTNVGIYGAGSAAVQLKSAMKYSPEIKIIAFLEQNCYFS